MQPPRGRNTGGPPVGFSAQEAQELAFLMDARVFFRMGLPGEQVPPAGVEVYEIVESIQAARLLLKALKAEGYTARWTQRMRKAVRRWSVVLSTQDSEGGASASGGASAIADRLLHLVAAFGRRSGTSPEEEREVLFKDYVALFYLWSDLLKMVEGRDALYRAYYWVKGGRRDIGSSLHRAQDDLRSMVRDIRRALSTLRRRRRGGQSSLPALRYSVDVHGVAQVTPVVEPARVVVQPAQASPLPAVSSAPAKERRKKAALPAAASPGAPKKQRPHRDKKAVLDRLARERGMRAALRRRNKRRLSAALGADTAQALRVHWAVCRALQFGAAGEQSPAVLKSLRRAAGAQTLVEVIDQYDLYQATEVLVGRYDNVSDDEDLFKTVVDSASDGGRDAERRLLEAVERLGVEVHRDRFEDRKAAVDASVVIDGRRVYLQLTTMSWCAAYTPSEAYAKKRMLNGAEEVGPAVSKVQKDIEKFRARHPEAPFVIIGVNVEMPFTPEQYAQDVVRLLERKASSGTTTVAFFVAPGCATFIKEDERK